MHRLKISQNPLFYVSDGLELLISTINLPIGLIRYRPLLFPLITLAKNEY
jgi:hypothetical protein